MIAPLASHKGCHCQHREPSALALFFRRAIAAVRRKPVAPEVPSTSSGAAEAARFPCCAHCDVPTACDPPDAHPVACSDGCNAPVHPVTDPAGIPVLGDKMLSEVREQYDGEPYAPAPWRPVPTFTSTPETAHAQAMHELSARFLPAPETIGGYPVTYHRPVNGRNLGTRPRRNPETAAYLAEEQAEADRAAYVRSQMRGGMAARDPETLRQVLTGLRKL